MYCVGAVIWAGVQDLDNRCSGTGQQVFRNWTGGTEKRIPDGVKESRPYLREASAKIDEARAWRVPAAKRRSRIPRVGDPSAAASHATGA